MNIQKFTQETTTGISRSDELRLLSLSYATLVGIGVTAINHEHGMLIATKAGLVQFMYKGTSALFLLAIYEKLSKRGDALSDELKTIGGVSALSIAINTAVHYYAGTPEILLTMLPLGTITIVGTTAVHIRRRCQELGDDLIKIKI